MDKQKFELYHVCNILCLTSVIVYFSSRFAECVGSTKFLCFRCSLNFACARARVTWIGAYEMEWLSDWFAIRCDSFLLLVICVWLWLCKFGCSVSFHDRCWPIFLISWLNFELVVMRRTCNLYTVFFLCRWFLWEFLWMKTLVFVHLCRMSLLLWLFFS